MEAPKSLKDLQPLTKEEVLHGFTTAERLLSCPT